MIHYHSRRTTDTSRKAAVRLPNCPTIQACEVHHWLGVWMDSKLSFKHHIKTKSAAAMRVFMTIFRLANTEEGLSQKSLRQLYVTRVTTVSYFGQRYDGRDTRSSGKTSRGSRIRPCTRLLWHSEPPPPLRWKQRWASSMWTSHWTASTGSMPSGYLPCNQHTVFANYFPTLSQELRRKTKMIPPT